MKGKCFQPFPWSNHQGQIELSTSGKSPWLEVEIAEQHKSLARVRAQDLALGKRLEVQLKLAHQMANLLAPRFTGETIRMQLHDEDPGVGCLRMDAPIGASTNISPLIPDPYCIGTNGYTEFRKQLKENPLPDWRNRIPVFFWRGSTTGSKDITCNTLDENMRFRLCQYSIRHPALVDARFNRVVQCKNSQSEQEVNKKLLRNKLISETVNPWHSSLHAWLIDIDGNVNSWGLMWKLLSGCCVLRVYSYRQQWFHRHLVPWIHVVPVAPDLSNFEERLEWCLKNRHECELIGKAGQTLGVQIISDLSQDLCDATVRYAQHWLRK